MGPTMSRKGRAFPQSKGRSPLKRHDRSLIWTAASLPRHMAAYSRFYSKRETPSEVRHRLSFGRDMKAERPDQEIDS